MAIKIKLLRNNIKSSKNYGKYYGKAITMGEVSFEDFAKLIQKECSLKEADVISCMKALVAAMKKELAEGRTVELEGLGRFRLSVESECVDDPKDFDVRKHIRQVIPRFLPASHRDDGTLLYDFSEEVKVNLLVK